MIMNYYDTVPIRHGYLGAYFAGLGATFICFFIVGAFATFR